MKDEAEYKVVLPSFLIKSKHFKLRQSAKTHETGISDYDAFEKYVKGRQILDEKVDGFGRIQIIWDTTSTTTRASTSSNNATKNLVSYVNVVAMLVSFIRQYIV